MANFMGLSKGEWLEVVIAVHLVVGVWLIVALAVMGAINIFGGSN